MNPVQEVFGEQVGMSVFLLNKLYSFLVNIS